MFAAAHLPSSSDTSVSPVVIGDEDKETVDSRTSVRVLETGEPTVDDV